MIMKEKIGISLRVVDALNYVEKRDALSHDWPKLFDELELIPIFIPNILKNIQSFLDELSLNGIVLSGGDDIGENDDRDKTENFLLKYAIDKKIPVIGICRGMQLINNYFGGKQIIDNNNQHIGNNHEIKIINHEISQIFNSKTIEVNSFHKNMINNDNLGNDLNIFATFEKDESIEGFIHSSLPIIGVMWHPERNPNKNNKQIISKIFKDKDFWNKLI
ncbi:MAG: peptidase C26 [Thaumarchaeota archaeon]|nr:MAG: peptidase C26 [Nitrososphaerota archaeon]